MFPNETSLAKHNNLHQGFPCGLCDKSFTSRGSLKTHRWKAHKKESGKGTESGATTTPSVSKSSNEESQVIGSEVNASKSLEDLGRADSGVNETETVEKEDKDDSEGYNILEENIERYEEVIDIADY